MRFKCLVWLGLLSIALGDPCFGGKLQDMYCRGAIALLGGQRLNTWYRQLDEKLYKARGMHLLDMLKALSMVDPKLDKLPHLNRRDIDEAMQILEIDELVRAMVEGPKPKIDESSLRMGSLLNYPSIGTYKKGPHAWQDTHDLYYQDENIEEVIPPKIQAASRTFRDSAKYFLSQVKEEEKGKGEGKERTLKGKLGGYEFFGELAPKPTVWWQTNFTSAEKAPLFGEDRKVYLNIPFKNLKADIPVISKLAEGKGAYALKFVGTDRTDRTDKVVVYFARAATAFKFTEAAADWCHEKGYHWKPPEFSFHVKTHPNSPVGLGVDSPHTSWRDQVANELTSATLAFGDREDFEELTLRYLRSTGIDPEYWLPIKFVEKHRKELDKLRGN